MTLNGSFSKHRYIGSTLPVVVCLLAASAAYWLHRQSEGGAQASGVAEVKEFTVSPMETGRVAAVDVVPGQRVSRGQLLARLDTGIVEREIAVAETESRELEARITAEDRSLIIDGLRTERAFQSELEQNETELQTAQAGYARDRAELAAVREELSRQRDLVARRLTDASRMRDLEVKVAALEQGVAAWPVRTETLEKRREAARERLAEWLRKAGIRSGSEGRDRLRPLELRASSHREYLELMKKRLDNLNLRAPAGGRVATILAREGAVLKPGDPVMVIVEEARQVVAYVDEERGYRIAVGDEAVLRPRTGTATRVTGQVAAIAGTVSQMPTRFWPAPNRPRWGRQVFIRIGGGLDPGQAVDIVFRPRTEASRPAAPPDIADTGAAPTGR
jgi:multidrug resistance efflux pump